MRLTGFASVVREVRPGSQGVAHTRRRRGPLQTSMVAGPAPLRFVWQRNPLTGRLEGAWHLCRKGSAGTASGTVDCGSNLARLRLIGGR
jgi:hypothetical protein